MEKIDVKSNLLQYVLKNAELFNVELGDIGYVLCYINTKL